MDIQPYTVQIPEADLVDLQTRLAHTRWPDEIAGADWEYGTSLAYLHDLVRTHDGVCHRHGADAMKKLETLPEAQGLRNSA